MNVLIVCHAGSGIGLGHLTRSLVIGKALQKKFDTNVRYLIQSEPIRRRDLDEFGYDFLPPEGDLAAAIETIRPVDLILLDLQPHRVSSNLQPVIRRLRTEGIKVVAIDGLRDYREDLDLIFIPSYRLDVADGCQTGAPVVFGWDCYLLDAKDVAGEWTPGNQVLALTGGSDATGLGLAWPSLLNEELPSSAVLDWVTGPFSSMPIIPKPARIKINQHIAPEGLGQLMRQANYAVTVFGVSFFELLFHGVPTVVFSPYGDKDAAVLKGIAEAGVALIAKDEKDATKQLVSLMSDDALARRLSEKAHEILCVSGTVRLCSEISKLMH